MSRYASLNGLIRSIKDRSVVQRASVFLQTPKALHELFRLLSCVRWPQNNLHIITYMDEFILSFAAFAEQLFEELQGQGVYYLAGPIDTLKGD